MEIRLVFMGSPEFALPSLQAAADNYTVVGVVTQPDRPAGRGRTLTPPPVKKLALELGLPVIQPKRLKEPEAIDQLKTWAPDLIIVAAFGQILRPEVLNLPRYGCLNVHASLLPRWRGAAPIPAAILNGDSSTGITLMQMDAGLDTGPMLAQRSIPIKVDDTAQTLGLKLAQIGADLLLATLPAYLAGDIRPVPQQDELATYAPKLEKSAGELVFTQSASQLARQVRAYNPWPGSYLFWQGQMLKIFQADAVKNGENSPGRFTVYQNLPAVCTSDGLLVLLEVQPAGKQKIRGEDFLRGARSWSSAPLD
jgi:methionyl-tRNA formyltransferase